LKLKNVKMNSFWVFSIERNKKILKIENPRFLDQSPSM
jgi:hypothetical protein